MGFIKQFDAIEISYPANLVRDPEIIDSTDTEKLEISIGQKKEHLDFISGVAPLAIGSRFSAWPVSLQRYSLRQDLRTVTAPHSRFKTACR